MHFSKNKATVCCKWQICPNTSDPDNVQWLHFCISCSPGFFLFCKTSSHTKFTRPTYFSPLFMLHHFHLLPTYSTSHCHVPQMAHCSSLMTKTISARVSLHTNEEVKWLFYPFFKDQTLRGAPETNFR